MQDRRRWRPEAGEKHVLLSSLEGAKVIKEDFRKGRIIAHNYNYALGLVRSEESEEEELS